MYKSSARLGYSSSSPAHSPGSPLHGAPSIRNDDVRFNSIVLSCIVGSSVGAKGAKHHTQAHQPPAVHKTFKNILF